MTIQRLLTAVCLPLLALPGVAWAQPDQKSFSLSYENDVFQNEDEGYTNGVRASWVSPENDLPRPVEFLQNNALTPLSQHIPMFPAEGKKRFSYAIGQSMFTPADIKRVVPNPNDRPYAGWLYGSVGFTNYTDTALDSLELTLGVVGPASLAEQTQKVIHRRVTGSNKPQGWDYQLKNEPGFILTYERKGRNFFALSEGGLQFDFTPHGDVSLGNVFTMASAGGTVRFGQHLPDDYGPPRVKPSIGGTDYFNAPHDWGWYLFAGAEGRAVARNIFLDGNTFRSSPSVDKKPFVGDLQAGVAVLYKNTRLSFTTVYRTDEFHGQTKNDRFGVLTLTVNY